MINLQGFPTGVITFLFTDREGRLKPWEDYRYEMKAAFARHDSILKSAVENNYTKIIKTTGDGLHAAISSASRAINAVLAAQMELMGEPWGATGPLRMCTALHSREAEYRDGDI